MPTIELIKSVFTSENRAFLRERLQHEGWFWVCATLLAIVAVYVINTLFSRRPLLCRLGFHSWQTLAVNHRRVIHMIEFHSAAGELRECRRCRHTWNDLNGLLVRNELGELRVVEQADFNRLVREAVQQRVAAPPAPQDIGEQDEEQEEAADIEETPPPRPKTEKRSTSKVISNPKTPSTRATRFERDVFGEDAPPNRKVLVYRHLMGVSSTGSKPEQSEDTSSPTSLSERKGSRKA